jgi:Zn-dependent protease
MSDVSTLITIVLPVIVISITLHEMMHAVVGAWLGDETARHKGRISFNPIRHVDPYLTVLLPLFLFIVGAPIFAVAKPVEVNMWRLKFHEFGMAIVALAGPLTNLLLAVIAATLFNSLQPDNYWGRFLVGMVEINIGLFIFNSIPWPPLDGSRLLYAFAPESVQDFMMRIEQAGFAGLLIFMLLFYQFISPAVGNLVARLTNGLLL